MKIYIPKVRENWIIDRIRKEWYDSSNNISTKFITSADIIWINAPWAWEKLNKKKLNSKLVVSTIHHIEENNSLYVCSGKSKILSISNFGTTKECPF